MTCNSKLGIYFECLLNKVFKKYQNLTSERLGHFLFVFYLQIVGLTLSQGVDDLALIYLAIIQAIAVSHYI